MINYRKAIMADDQIVVDAESVEVEAIEKPDFFDGWNPAAAIVWMAVSGLLLAFACYKTVKFVIDLKGFIQRQLKKDEVNSFRVPAKKKEKRGLLKKKVKGVDDPDKKAKEAEKKKKKGKGKGKGDDKDADKRLNTFSEVYFEDMQKKSPLLGEPNEMK